MDTADECASNICALVPAGFMSSPPGLAGNAFILAAFAALIPWNIYAGIKHRNPLYTSLVVSGLVLEVVSHIGKILLHSDVANPTYFSLYLVANLWAPTLIGSAIYTVLPHVMAIHGLEFRIASCPIHLNIFFAVLDIFTLAFLTVGVVFASHGASAVEMSQGASISIAGLSIHLATLAVFIAMYCYVNYRTSYRRHILDSKLAVVFLSSRFKIFALGILIATFLLILRASTRIAAFSTGLSGKLFQSEVVSYVLDDSPVLLACIILSISPPGRAFGSSWKDTAPVTCRRYGRSAVRLPLRSPCKQRQSVRERGISQPYPSTSIFIPSSPRSYHAVGKPPTPKLVSPHMNPVYQRPPYDLSPAVVVPFMAPEASSPLSGVSPSNPKKKKPWVAASPDANRLVNPDGIWS